MRKRHRCSYTILLPAIVLVVSIILALIALAIALASRAAHAQTAQIDPAPPLAAWSIIGDPNTPRRHVTIAVRIPPTDLANPCIEVYRFGSLSRVRCHRMRDVMGDDRVAVLHVSNDAIGGDQTIEVRLDGVKEPVLQKVRVSKLPKVQWKE